MRGTTIAVGLTALALGLAPSVALARGASLELAEGGQTVPAGTEIGFSGTIEPQGRAGTGQFAGAGPLLNDGARTDRWSALAAAAGGYEWAVEGSARGLSLSSSGVAVLTTKHMAISPRPVGPPPPPPPPPAAVRASASKECWYRLPGRMTGSFPLPGLAVITVTGAATPSKACTEPGFQATLTLTFYSERLAGRPTLETRLAG